MQVPGHPQVKTLGQVAADGRAAGRGGIGSHSDYGLSGEMLIPAASKKECEESLSIG